MLTIIFSYLSTCVVFLAPLEAVRIRLVSDRKYATNLATGFKRMAAEGGLKELYAAFIPLYLKQGPYSGQYTNSLGITL